MGGNAFQGETQKMPKQMRNRKDSAPLKVKEDLGAAEVKEVEQFTILERKIKVPSHFINSYFTTGDTLKTYQKQLSPDFKMEQNLDTTEAKEGLAIMVSKGFRGMNLSYSEKRVIKGIFSLAQKQKVSENQPFIVLRNISQFLNEILEKKARKTSPGGRSFKDFFGAEVEQIKKALDNLSKKQQQIIIKGYDGIDKKTGKPMYFFYMREIPLISIEYLKRRIPEGEVEKLTEGEVKETGYIKISILPIILRGFHNYFKMLPKDISKEVREKCHVKRISVTLVDFIDLLHRQNNREFRRTRLTLTKELKLEKQLKKRGKTYIKRILLKCYDQAKRIEYLEDYKIDQRGTSGLVDVFYLNIFKFEHLKPKKTIGYVSDS
jgi:ribosomal protein L32E